MSKIWKGRSITIAVGIAAILLAVWLAWPQPIPADLAVVSRAAMEVTIDDEARTRVRHIYTVSAPLAAKVLRTSLEVGDQVVADQTVVAALQPVTPAFHDARTHAELRGVLAAAESAVSLAQAEQRRIEAALTYSRTELERAQTLVDKGTISRKALDKAALEVQTNQAALASARALLDVRRFERDSAAARLQNPSSVASATDPACCIQLRAPVTGRVLRRIQESEAVVPASTPLVELGDPQDLEVMADLLSSDAVQVKPGQPVRIDDWGGPTIQGRVRRVEPAGFLKVSALGIEEQRVRVTIDFVDPPSAWSSLGHDYRVNVHIAVWSANSVLTVPVGALFRDGEKWAAFTVTNGRARLSPVSLGRRNRQVAQVLSGLAEGAQVVVHPNDRIVEGASVAARTTR